MTTLAEAYERRDKSRLEIGTLALEEIERRVKEDSSSGKTAPYRICLSETLECLSQEFAKYHASARACRSYLSDSIRLSRFFTPDVVEELQPYGLTTSHMLACLVPGEWPEANQEATQSLVDWTIKNHADPEQIWNKRKKDNDLFTKEQSTWNKVLKIIEKYLEVSAPLEGKEISARRNACIQFAQTNTDKKEDNYG